MRRGGLYPHSGGGSDILISTCTAAVRVNGEAIPGGPADSANLPHPYDAGTPSAMRYGASAECTLSIVPHASKRVCWRHCLQ
jgi:hypothetical protein